MSKFSLQLICLVFVFCAIAAVATPTDTFTTLATFNGSNGVDPQYANLVQGSNGNLYGTTIEGGANGDGTVFQITAKGKLTKLYNFCSQSACTDGDYPYAGLAQATNGNLYGTTFYGGANGVGTVFQITTNGKLTTLYSFCSKSGCTDGTYPQAGLVQATNGNFYSTTPYGGANNEGTVFQITANGKLTTLYSFCSKSSCTDGANPYAGLVQATNGNFYSTTPYGGANNEGTVFQITANGKLTTLYSFCSQSGCADGANPQAGLVQATNGNFYGTTLDGGTHRHGTVFQITANGKLTKLYNFCSQSGCTDGDYPYPGPVQATNGNFYGTTVSGGANNEGTVFSLATGLGPFVETLPTSGKVGAAVTILGNSLTGATSVTFNGTTTAFTVVSSTEITTTVPSGATTGKVVVTTPGATLTSNANFQVK